MTKVAKNGMPQTDLKGLKLFSDEHGNSYTIENVLWANVTFNPNANVRPRDEFDADKWDHLELVQKLRGLKKPKTNPAFHFDTKTGELTILRGNRRYLAYEVLRAEAPENTNYQSIEAHVYRDLPSDVQAIIKMDHSATEKALSEYGLHLSIIECKKMGKSEPETIAILRGALAASHSTDKNPKSPNDAPEVFKQYRGFVRTSRWANDMGVVENEYIEKLKGKQSFPGMTDVVELHQAFLADVEGSQILTRDTVQKGKTFKPMWEAKLAKFAKDKIEGKRTRGGTKLTPEKIKNLAFGSVMFNAIKKCVLMTAKNPTAWVDVLDPIMKRLESVGLTEQDIAIIERETASESAASPEPTVPAPAPVAKATVAKKTVKA